MKLDLSDKQFELLKDVLSEYAEECYQSMFELQRTAMDADDEAIKAEYNKLAQSEEERFNEVHELADFIERYGELMRGRD